MEGNQEYKLLGLKERSSKDVVYRTGNTVNILIITLYGVYSIKTLNYVVHLELKLRLILILIISTLMS